MKSNIVLLTIDSLRADHLGCYGYARNTSPHLDEMAEQSTVFERAFATGIPTMPSFTTLLSGLHPYRHGITAHASEQRAAPDLTLLAQMAKDAGYVTVAIDNLVTQAAGRGGWFARGFDYYSSFLYQPFSSQCEHLTERAISYFEQLRAQPFLLWIHFWDTHSPYGPPSPFDLQHFDPQHPSGTKLSDVIARAPEYYREFLADMKLKVADDYDYIVAQYDGEISYLDTQIGRLTDSLKALNLWDDSHVIALADHGEGFGEDGIFFDHHGLCDAVTRIPLLWKPPQSTLARRCDAMISHEDITPTLIECCELTAPEYELTGRSFAPVLRGEAFAGREEIISVESTRQCSISLRTRDWKLVQPIVRTRNGRALPDIYGRARDPEVLLYALANDPHEARDVSEEFPIRRDEMQARLNAWRQSEIARRGGDDPLDYGLSLEYSEFMQRLTGRKLRG